MLINNPSFVPTKRSLFSPPLGARLSRTRLRDKDTNIEIVPYETESIFPVDQDLCAEDFCLTNILSMGGNPQPVAHDILSNRFDVADRFLDMAALTSDSSLMFEAAPDSAPDPASSPAD